MSSTLLERMSVEEFLALPDDGVERELINGVVKIRGGAATEMTYRNRFHSITVGRLSVVLGQWCQSRPEEVEFLSGDVGFVLRYDPPVTVGTDVAIVSRELLQRQSEATSLIAGAPILAVEVLSPSDKNQDVHEKIRLYLECGAGIVWIVDPEDRTLRVYRADQPPVLFNETQEMLAGPELPGLSIRIGDLFLERQRA